MAAPNRWRGERQALAIILLGSLALRLGAAVLLGDRVAPLPGIHDQLSYDALAVRVLAGHGFSFERPWWPLTAAGAPTAHWSFLYTLYLAGVYGLVGHHPLAARLLQAGFSGVLLPWLVHRLARRSFGPAAGLTAAGIAAMYAYFIYYSAALMTETFFTLAVLCVFDRLHTASRPTVCSRDWLALGTGFGMAVLLRQSFFPVIALGSAWLVFSAQGRRRAVLKGLAISLGVTALMVLPFTFRNFRAFHRWVLLNTNAGYAFYFSNHPSQGVSFSLFETEAYIRMIPLELRDLDEASLEKALLDSTLENIRQNPVRYMRLSLSRLKDQFQFWPSPASPLLSNLARMASYTFWLPWMLAGIVLAARRLVKHRPGGWQSLLVGLAQPPALWLGFFILYNTLHLASWAGTRYRLPTDAVLIPFAGLAASQVLYIIQRWQVHHKFTLFHFQKL